MPKITNSKTIFKTQRLEVQEKVVEFDKETRRFQIVVKGDSVMMIPVKKDGKIILIKEYFPAIDKYLYSFPKGKIDNNESPEKTVERELQEEIGYRPNKVQYLHSLFVSPGYLSQTTHLFICEDLTESSLQGDEAEKIEQFEFTKDEIDKLIQSGEINEARVVSGYFLFTNRSSSLDN